MMMMMMMMMMMNNVPLWSPPIQWVPGTSSWG